MHKRNNANVKVRRQGKARGWVVLLIVAAVVVGGYAVIKGRKAAGAGPSIGGTFTVRQDDLTVTVSEGGSIRAHHSIQYKCQVESRGAEVTIINIVPGGTYVTQEDVDNGMVLVKLDSSQLEDQLVQQQMELASDEENATAAKEAYDIQGIQNESDIAQAKLAIRFALLDLQKYLGVDLATQLTADVDSVTDLTAHAAPVITQVMQDPNVLKRSEAAQLLKGFRDDIVTSQGSLATAKARAVGTLKLYDANYVSELDKQRDELAVVNSEFSESDARVRLELWQRYTFPKDAEKFLSDYIESLRELERTFAKCRSQLAQAQARLSNANQQFAHQEERVRDLEQQIEYCVMRAKAPGLVIYGSGDSGDAFRMMRGGRGGGGSGIIAEGETVYEGQTLISMPDTAAMVAEISVHETEVDKVRAGQPATIVMDAFPDRELKGQVLEVAPLPDQSRSFMSPDLKVYQTLVRIDGTHDFLRTRMSCKVTILVEKIKNAAIVPIQVVANRQGEKVVYVAKGSSSEKRVVVTGAFNDTFVEIKSGLQAGEEVLLNPPLFAEGINTNDAFKDQDATVPRTEAQPRAAIDPNRAGARQMPAGMAEAMKNMDPNQLRQIRNAMQRSGGPGDAAMPQGMGQRGQGRRGGGGQGQGMPGGTPGQRRPGRGGTPGGQPSAPANE
ncbi:MAG: HlyD family efflux transporter periplasmic adaptor subunit [Phycisphaerae bacterium]|nr:HlyD family efflux transporter periplasmic adaptor subunit [Phycisphaerae bacterium]